jgi:hypothetical protein
MCSTEEAIYYNAIVEQFVAKLQKQLSVQGSVFFLLLFFSILVYFFVSNNNIL